jgi:hypothetical protein
VGARVSRQALSGASPGVPRNPSSNCVASSALLSANTEGRLQEWTANAGSGHQQAHLSLVHTENFIRTGVNLPMG